MRAPYRWYFGLDGSVRLIYLSRWLGMSDKLVSMAPYVWYFGSMSPHEWYIGLDDSIRLIFWSRCLHTVNIWVSIAPYGWYIGLDISIKIFYIFRENIGLRFDDQTTIWLIYDHREQYSTHHWSSDHNLTHNWSSRIVFYSSLIISPQFD